jgi:superfamily II DNA helicase RecQ
MVLLAVDEAHLIIDWAAYRHLGYGMLHKLAGRLPAWLRIAILSATIPLSDYEQIQQTLMMKQIARHIDVHMKENIHHCAGVQGLRPGRPCNRPRTTRQ